LPGSRTASKAKQDLPQCAKFFADFLSRKSNVILPPKEMNIKKSLKKQKTKFKSKRKFKEKN
jgi:hypothetical protein